MSQVSYPHLVLLHGVCMAGDSEPRATPHASPGLSSTLLYLHASDTLKIITPYAPTSHPRPTPGHTDPFPPCQLIAMQHSLPPHPVPTPPESWLYLFS
jgi:hypothetical protein